MKEIVTGAKLLTGYHVMAKPGGPICNLDCKYCFYLEKENLYPGKHPWKMPDRVLESYIREYIESQISPTITFAWQGGEPTLLGIEFFRKVVELQRKHARGKNIANVLQTNGILLNDRWAEFLKEHHFLVGVSIDGPPELHDCFRVNKSGRATFDSVMAGIGYLKKHGVDFNTLTVVHRRNSCHPREVYRFLREAGSGYMQFIPLVERIANPPGPDGLRLVGPQWEGPAEVSEWSVEPLQFGKFLCAIFDEWVRRDVARYFVQIFDVALESWYGMTQGLCVFREVCGAALAIEHNGDLYSCDHYVYPENKLGNILQASLESMAASIQQRRFGAFKRDSLPHHCLECEVRFACHGECPKHRFTRTPDGEPGLNYLCAGYKMFFNHIDPYMKFMAEELRRNGAPANVMEWARLRNSRPQAGKDKLRS